MRVFDQEFREDCWNIFPSWTLKVSRAFGQQHYQDAILEKDGGDVWFPLFPIPRENPTEDDIENFADNFFACPDLGYELVDFGIKAGYNREGEGCFEEWLYKYLLKRMREEPDAIG